MIRVGARQMHRAMHGHASHARTQHRVPLERPTVCHRGGSNNYNINVIHRQTLRLFSTGCKSSKSFGGHSLSRASLHTCAYGIPGARGAHTAVFTLTKPSTHLRSLQASNGLKSKHSRSRPPVSWSVRHAGRAGSAMHSRGARAWGDCRLVRIWRSSYFRCNFPGRPMRYVRDLLLQQKVQTHPCRLFRSGIMMKCHVNV